MPRLILFSGGVESTALVTMADKADVLLTSELPFKTYKSGYDLERCKAIAKIRGHRLVTFHCEMRLNRAKWMHQLNWLLMAANLFVNAEEGFDEVWIGLQPQDVKEEFKQALYERMFAMWDALCPGVKLSAPLRHLTKKMQWDLIPEELRPLVNSCLLSNDCGQCRKCLEFRSVL